MKGFWYFLVAASAVAVAIHLHNRDLPYFFGRSKANLSTPPPAGEIVVAPDGGGTMIERWPERSKHP